MARVVVIGDKLEIRVSMGSISSQPASSLGFRMDPVN